MPQQFDVTVSDLETLPGADLQDGDRILVSSPGAFDKTVTWGDVRTELGGEGSVGGIEDVPGLQSALDSKAAATHTHAAFQSAIALYFAQLDVIGTAETEAIKNTLIEIAQDHLIAIPS